MKSNMLAADLTHLALLSLESPPFVTVSGRKVSAPVFFSDSIAEPILYWLSGNLALNLHSSTLFDLSLLSSQDRVSGSMINSFNTKSNLLGHERNESGLGMTSCLLLIAEAADQILMPARKKMGLDYEHLIFEFKRAVRVGYKESSKISLDDMNISNAIFSVLNQFDPTNPTYKPEVKKDVKR